MRLLISQKLIAGQQSRQLYGVRLVDIDLVVDQIGQRCWRMAEKDPSLKCSMSGSVTPSAMSCG